MVNTEHCFFKMAFNTDQKTIQKVALDNESFHKISVFFLKKYLPAQ